MRCTSVYAPWLLCLCVLASCKPSPPPRSLTQGGLTGTLLLNPDPPREGHDNTLGIQIVEAGAPVTGAAVLVSTTFTGLNQTGPNGACSEVGPGRYEAREMSMGMAGTWEAVFQVTRPGKPDARFKFEFKASH